MTDISLTPPLDDAVADAPGAADASMFYVVSRRKFAILFIATFGMYSLFWFFKNWSQYRYASQLATGTRPSIWPLPRALFMVFFVHSLFSKVKAYGADKPGVAAWRDQLHAWVIVGLLVGLNVLDLLERFLPRMPLADLLSFAGMVLLLYSSLRAQAMINASCGDPEGARNNKLTGANYVWILLGGLVWVLTFIGAFTSGAPDGYSGGSSF
ncbi:hypothetical protein GCM10027321_07410 [Massilia terrae]|uniref:MFS transporter permease n=1 Tax=Massilia terrae TaxID=1811224 RepID=A0ABT2D0I3_9BURK|nr:hypothetical protein [Massilia terrae]MCS0659687.1 hypothetical protein [Massilia terrae]